MSSYCGDVVDFFVLDYHFILVFWTGAYLFRDEMTANASPKSSNTQTSASQQPVKPKIIFKKTQTDL